MKKQALFILLLILSINAFGQFTISFFDNSNKSYIDHFDTVILKGKYLDTIIKTADMNKAKSGFILKNIPQGQYQISFSIFDYINIPPIQLTISNNGSHVFYVTPEPIEQGKPLNNNTGSDCFISDNFNWTLLKECKFCECNFEAVQEQDGTVIPIHNAKCPQAIQDEWTRVLKLMGPWTQDRVKRTGRVIHRKKHFFFVVATWGEPCK